MKLDLQLKETRTETYSGHITHADLVKALGLPPDVPVRITFAVPSGGDYSGVTLDIEDHPLQVEWSRTVETTS